MPATKALVSRMKGCRLAERSEWALGSAIFGSTEWRSVWLLGTRLLDVQRLILLGTCHIGKGILSLESRVWSLESGVWSLESGVWSLESAKRGRFGSGWVADLTGPTQHLRLPA